MEQIPPLPPSEASPAKDFDARAFLGAFREMMAESGQIIYGSIKTTQREELQVFLGDAEIVVQEQVQRTKSMLPEDIPESFLGLEEPYMRGFVRLVSGLGISALRFADKKNVSFINPPA